MTLAECFLVPELDIFRYLKVLKIVEIHKLKSGVKADK
jgi:hypothetical protein